MTTTGTATIAPRIAGTGINSQNGYTIVTTILPSNNQQSEIFATTLRNEGLQKDVPDKECLLATQKEVSDLKNLFDNADVREWLPKMARDWAFLYVCPMDYYGVLDDIRKSIEESIAEKFTAQQQ